MVKRTKQTKLGTFSPNHEIPIHSWYAYIEGYSSKLIEDQLDLLENKSVTCLYDPFGGSGTTPLVASQRGIKSYYSETNPFMQFVINTKINLTRIIVEQNLIPELIKFKKELETITFNTELYESWDGFEKYFDKEQLNILLQLKALIKKQSVEPVKSLLMLLLSAVVVRGSKAIRRGDLRFAKPGEKKPEDFEIKSNFIAKLEQAIDDLQCVDELPKCNSQMLSEDARNIDLVNEIDCVITSPPYLNGTNYIRNTKLELKLNDFINTEKDIPALHSKGIIAGINNVSKRNDTGKILPCVKKYYDAVHENNYDVRIEKMIAGYFNDMNDVIIKLNRAMKNNGILIIDIGDSQFNGVHIPTHDILSEICAAHGFEKYAEEVIRERKSNNGMVLSQRLLKFKLNKKLNDDEYRVEVAKKFLEDLPYKKEPYNGRNWGHPWHSLCSYHGKLKPAIAYHLIDTFTKKGDVILDPLSGVGTIPFESCLQGRIGIGNDLSELAYVVTKAKLEKPDISDVEAVLEKLREHIEANKGKYRDYDPYPNFGYNGKLHEYFEKNTYCEILAAREYFKGRISELSSSECLVFACLLHVLHGNRPYALSRNSHPLTPYKPTGEFVYKNVIEHIKDKIVISYKNVDFGDYCLGKAIYGDCNVIPLETNSVNAVICSPPFADSIRFYMQNWMRLWLCGWEPEDFNTADEKFLDVKQRKNFAVYDGFFKMCNRVLKDDGVIILHLGKTKDVDMCEELSKIASPYFKELYRGEENVGKVEKHGIKDKGATVSHQYLFLRKIGSHSD